MTKNLLVPTDFSENAFRAADYACKLASKNHYRVELFHCYTSKSTAFGEEGDNDPTLKADILIVELKDEFKAQYPELEIITTCVAGLIDEVIIQLSKSGKYSLIVMGTTGAGRGKSLIWGSTTSSIVSHAAIPVLAIPDGYKGFHFEQVAMLTNFRAEELETLTDYIQTVNAIPLLDIIHVFKDKEEQASVDYHLQSWAFNIQEINGVGKVSIITKPIEEKDKDLDTIPEVIQHIIAQKHYDILLVNKTRKSFFKRLISTSISKQIALHLNGPTFFDNN